MLSELQLCQLFQMLDIQEKYENMFDLILKHPKMMTILEISSEEFYYNFEHKWDGDLKKFMEIIPKEYIEDIKTKQYVGLNFIC